MMPNLQFKQFILIQMLQNQFLNIKAKINISIMFTRYNLSQSRTHSVSMEQNTCNMQLTGELDLAFKSIGLDQNWIIIENKFIKNVNKVSKESLEEIKTNSHLQIYSKGSASRLLQNFEEMPKQEKIKIQIQANMPKITKQQVYISKIKSKMND